MADTRYYIGPEDHLKGPYTLDQLRTAVQDLTLKRSVLVRAEGETEGRPLRELLAPVSGSRFGDEDQVLRRFFCDPCLAASTSHSPGNLMSINGFGRTFYGNGEKCKRCGSTVRVLWFVFATLPVIPLGTYRCQQATQDLFRQRFIARGTHTRWRQVLIHWAVALMTCAMLYAIAEYALSKH